MAILQTQNSAKAVDFKQVQSMNATIVPVGAGFDSPTANLKSQLPVSLGSSLGKGLVTIEPTDLPSVASVRLGMWS